MSSGTGSGPSTSARLLAFLAIAVGGLCGGLIGWSVTELQCRADDRPAAAASDPGDAGDPGAVADSGGCPAAAGAVGVAGAVTGAGGVAVIAVLVLRAMAEWREDGGRAGGAPAGPGRERGVSAEA